MTQALRCVEELFCPQTMINVVCTKLAVNEPLVHNVQRNDFFFVALARSHTHTHTEGMRERNVIDSVKLVQLCFKTFYVATI